MSNIMYMCRHQTKETDKDLITSLTFHTVFNMLNKYYNKLKPTHMVLAFDRPNWRKDYTESPKCVSGNIYKGDRNLKLTESEKELLKHFKESINIFEELCQYHTGMYTLSADKCEADDFIARFAQNYGDEHIVTILSSDKDYVQLLTSPNIKVMNPLKQQYRTLEEFDGNIELHNFMKHSRAGEDGIRCILPRVRKTRLQKAFDDPFEMVNLMQEKWHNENGKEFLVEELYKENCLLMDLTLQPDNIKKIMDDVIDDVMSNPNKLSIFHFKKFCGKYELSKLIKTVNYYKEMMI